MFFGFDWKIRRLRNRWNRLRNKALRQEKEKRIRLLEMLDDVENDLRVLEEQELTRVDRYRIMRNVENGLREVEISLKEE